MKKAIVFIITAVVIMFGACGVLPDYSEEVSSTQSPEASVQTEDVVDEYEAAANNENTVISENEDIELAEPDKGEAVVIDSLYISASNPEKEDAYFFTELIPFFYLGEDFEYDGLQYEEWWNVPELDAYNEAYKVWLEEVYPELDAEMQAAEARGEEQAQGWSSHNPQDYFDVYYEYTQDAETVEAWKTAKEKALEAQQAYEDWTNTDEYIANEYGLIVSETERLQDEGCIVELDGWCLKGYLTQEQIKAFDCGDYGYQIVWANAEGCAEK